MTIPVATASDDPRQPLLFRSPGNARPDQWTDGRAGERQRGKGLAEIAGMRIGFAAGVTPGLVFVALAAQGLITLDHGAVAPTMELDLSRADGGARAIVRLPDCIFM